MGQIVILKKITKDEQKANEIISKHNDDKKLDGIGYSNTFVLDIPSLTENDLKKYKEKDDCSLLTLGDFDILLKATKEEAITLLDAKIKANTTLSQITKND